MTREEAIEYAEKKNLKLEEEIERPGSYYGAYAMYSTELEFVSMAISALRQRDVTDKDVGKNDPLTLNELREMPIRDWVWIEILNPDAFRSKETVSAYYRKYDGYKKDEIFWCGYPGLGFGFDYADYGKTWLAYRQKKEV